MESLASTLFRDGLGAIFSFLDWKHSKVWQVSKQWRSGAICAKSRGMALATADPEILKNLLGSTLGHHVANVEVRSQKAEALLLIMPIIRQMTWLTSLTLDTRDPDTLWMDFSPVTQLHRLRSIAFIHKVDPIAPLAHLQLALVKQLPSLTTISMHVKHAVKVGSMPWSSEDLVVLCSPPHQLQSLESINLDTTLMDVSRCSSLIDLPALMELATQCFNLDWLPLVEKFPCLTRMQLHLERTLEAIPKLATFARCLHRITTLELMHTSLGEYESSEKSVSLQSVMTHLVSLTHLTLTRCINYSLHDLAVSPNLHSLHLHRMRGLIFSHIGQLIECSKLRTLEITPFTTVEFDDVHIIEVLPQLTTCIINQYIRY